MNGSTDTYTSLETLYESSRVTTVSNAYLYQACPFPNLLPTRKFVVTTPRITHTLMIRLI